MWFEPSKLPNKNTKFYMFQFEFLLDKKLSPEKFYLPSVQDL